MSKVISHKGISYREVTERLKENKIHFAELKVGDNLKLVISERGGRILGPFLEDTGEGIFWINGAFGDSDNFKQFISKNEWNLGGERFWLAPEVQFYIKDRYHFWDTYKLPESIDPGKHILDDSNTSSVSLSQNITVEAYNLVSGKKEVKVERLIRSTENPLKSLNGSDSIMKGVSYAGYEHTVRLSEVVHNDVMCENWILIQLNPGGKIYIPCSPEVEEVNYFEPVEPGYRDILKNHVRLKITGDKRYKVGYKSAHVFGRLGYLNSLSDGRNYLLIRNFYNNPSAPYTEEPPDSPGHSGQSVHIYNDGGNFGGFGELECNGQPVGGKTNRTDTVDYFTLWIYIGDIRALKEIALHLLGIEIA